MADKEAKVTLRGDLPAEAPAAKTEAAAEMPLASAAVASPPYKDFDIGGRKLRARWLNAAERMRVFRYIGAENAANQAYLSYCLVLATISHIDGQPETMPTSWREFEAVAQRIGDEAYEAVEGWVMEYGKERNAKSTIANAKN